ncbi:MAG: hypothetical protein IPK78_20465 [Rhodospirillales bacterium]|nr:hypothetical protein [Rhodospirillales bacterium]
MIKQVALNVAEVQFVRRVTRAVLFGLSKHLEPNNWQSGHIEKAISPEALSLVVEDLDDLLPPALLLARDFISEMRAAV